MSLLADHCRRKIEALEARIEALECIVAAIMAQGAKAEAPSLEAVDAAYQQIREMSK